MSLANIRHRGFSLLEVLITIFVLAVGFLGLAQLQIRSFHANQNAIYRSQAALFAEGMFDRMRANKAAAQLGEYEIDSETEATTLSGPNTIRTIDISQWRANLIASLPEGKGEINCDPCGNNSIYDVEVRWKKFEQHNLITTDSYNSIHVYGAL